MKVTECLKLFTALLFLLSSTALATPYYGATFSYPLWAKEPSDLRGFQLMLSYDPQSIQWQHFNVYFDGGFSRFWVTSTPYYHSLNIYSAAPVVRYTFNKHGPFLPYLEFSIGVAYLTRTHIDSRNLGMHFSFQDRLGVGALLGASEQFSIGLHAVHYSNGRLCAHNSGITVPVMLDIGYRFQ